MVQSTSSLEGTLHALASRDTKTFEEAFQFVRQLLEPFLTEAHRFFSSYVLDSAMGPEGTFSPSGTIEMLRLRNRTIRLLEAVDSATKENVRDVIDAGTGPFPLLALQAACGKDVQRVIGLELNPASAYIAEGVVGAFGMSERIQIREVDGTKFRPEHPVDLVISETLHQVSLLEPAVKIMINLRRSLRPDGRLIPRKLSYFFEQSGNTEKSPFATIDLKNDDGTCVEGTVTIPSLSFHPSESDTISLRMLADLGTLETDETMEIIEEPITFSLAHDNKGTQLRELLASGSFRIKIFPGTERIIFSSGENMEGIVSMRFIDPYTVTPIGFHG